MKRIVFLTIGIVFLLAISSEAYAQEAVEMVKVGEKITWGSVGSTKLYAIEIGNKAPSPEGGISHGGSTVYLNKDGNWFNNTGESVNPYSLMPFLTGYSLKTVWRIEMYDGGSRLFFNADTASESIESMTEKLRRYLSTRNISWRT